MGTDRSLPGPLDFAMHYRQTLRILNHSIFFRLKLEDSCSASAIEYRDHIIVRGEEQGSKSPVSLHSELLSPSSLLTQVSPVQFSLLPTFLFLPPPYFFPLGLFLPPPNFFWAFSTSSLFCSSPLYCRVSRILLSLLLLCIEYKQYQHYSTVQFLMFFFRNLL